MIALTTHISTTAASHRCAAPELCPSLAMLLAHHLPKRLKRLKRMA